MKYLYKYPQREYPYSDLVKTNRNRSRSEPEYELIDTGVFEDDRYFDVFVEYAKAEPGDILIQISVCNRGRDAAVVHLLPTLWFRNTWTWWPGQTKPVLQQVTGDHDFSAVAAVHDELGEYTLYCETSPPLLFTENETNDERIFGAADAEPYRKDAINDYVVTGRREAVNPAQTGTKAAAHYRPDVGGGATVVVRLRLSAAAMPEPFDARFGLILDQRRREADAFYAAITPPGTGADAANVMRQALAGSLWSKQYYFFDADKWLEEHGADTDALRPPAGPQSRMVSPARRPYHLDAGQVGISVVRRLGSRLSGHGFGFGRRRFRQAADRAAARTPVPAPDRANPCL